MIVKDLKTNPHTLIAGRGDLVGGKDELRKRYAAPNDNT